MSRLWTKSRTLHHQPPSWYAIALAHTHTYTCSRNKNHHHTQTSNIYDLLKTRMLSSNAIKQGITNVHISPVQCVLPFVHISVNVYIDPLVVLFTSFLRTPRSSYNSNISSSTYAILDFSSFSLSHTLFSSSIWYVCFYIHTEHSHPEKNSYTHTYAIQRKSIFGMYAVCYNGITYVSKAKSRALFLYALLSTAYIVDQWTTSKNKKSEKRTTTKLHFAHNYSMCVCVRATEYAFPLWYTIKL